MSDIAVDSPPPSSPVSPSRDLVAGLTVAIVAGALLAVGAHIGALALLIAVAIAQAALIGSWIVGTALPGRIGAAILASMAAAGADTVVSVWPHGQLGTLLPVLGLVMPVAFVHQLTRGVVRTRVVESLSDISVLIVATVSWAAFVQLRHELLPQLTVYAVVLAIAGALVAGYCTDLVLPTPRFDPAVRRGLPAVAVGAVVAALITQLQLGGELEFTAGRGLFVGAAIGVLTGLFAVGSAFIQAATSMPSTGRAAALQPVFGTLLPMALAAPVAYLLCLAIHA
jgi:hypothetical protein